MLFFFLHRYTEVHDPISPEQADKPLDSHSAIAQPVYMTYNKPISSETTTAITHRPSDRRPGCQQAVRHTTCGASRNNQGLDREIGKERRGELEAKTEDDPKLTGAQQFTVLQPNKSFTLGNTFLNVCPLYGHNSSVAVVVWFPSHMFVVFLLLQLEMVNIWIFHCTVCYNC